MALNASSRILITRRCSSHLQHPSRSPPPPSAPPCPIADDPPPSSSCAHAPPPRHPSACRITRRMAVPSRTINAVVLTQMASHGAPSPRRRPAAAQGTSVTSSRQPTIASAIRFHTARTLASASAVESIRMAIRGTKRSATTHAVPIPSNASRKTTTSASASTPPLWQSCCDR